MMRFMISRVIGLIAIALSMSLLMFVLVRLVPGDPALAATGEMASADMVEATRKELGLDQPLLVQYAKYVGRLLRGDLGKSFRSRRPVMEDIRSRFAATVELAVASIFVSLGLGLPLGLLAVWRRDWMGSVAKMMAATAVGIPPFWLGLLFLMFFFGKLGWLPSGGRFPMEATKPATITGLLTVDTLLHGDGAGFRLAIRHLSLPAFVLGMATVGLIARTTRFAVEEVLTQTHVVVARAKGLPARILYTRHVIRNATIPLLAISGVALGDMFAGAVLTESIFAWPGIGRYSIGAISFLDYPAVIGFVLVFVISYSVLNIIVDALIYFSDPRIRLR